MRVEKEIIKSALLGFKNHPLNIDIFPDEIKKHIIQESKERAFLEGLTLNFAYNIGGFEPTKIKNISQKLPTSPKEKLPYTSKEYQEFMRDIISEANYSFLSFFPILIDKINQSNSILPAKYIQKVEIKDQKTLKAFGETGAWIYSMKKEKSIMRQKDNLLEMKLEERKRFFEELLINSELDNALEFLKEIFDAENIKVKLWYLKIVQQYIHEGYEDILIFLEENINKSKSKSATQKELKNYIQRAKISIPNSKEFEEYYQKYFSQIFRKNLKTLKLRDRKELDDLLSKIPFLEEEFIYDKLDFIFSITPLSHWSKSLNLKIEEILPFVLKQVDTDQTLKPLISEIKKGDSFKIVDTILNSTKITKNRDNINFLKIDYLLELNDKEFMTLIDKHLNRFSTRRLLNQLHKHQALKRKWSLDFTEKLLRAYFNTYQYSELLESIWIIAPYMHHDGLKIIDQLIKEFQKKKNYYGTNKIEDGFETLSKITKKYNQLGA